MRDPSPTNPKAHVRGGNKHDPNLVEILQAQHAGGYDIDKRAPFDPDIPDCCAFGWEFNLLKLPRKKLKHCWGDNVVVKDKRHGVIPVCQGHKHLVQKQERRQYGRQK